MYFNYLVFILVHCGPEEMPALQTIGLVTAIRPPHGKCVNKESLQGFTRCVGTCNSSTSYNSRKLVNFCFKLINFNRMIYRNGCS